MPQHTGLILILALLAGFSWWLSQTQSPQEPPASLNQASDIDYYLNDVKTITLQLDGQPARTLYTDAIRHLSQSGITQLDHPVLFVHQPNKPPWRIEAETGEISPEKDWIFLYGEVQLTRAAAPPHIRPVQLYTRNASVHPERSYVETDEAVKVYSHQDWLHATGMRAWLGEPTNIQLSGRVKSFYAPPN
jgi:lipopolysaccharide export system protein LptC